MSQTTTYYLRFRGRVSGPYNLEQLQRMARRGQVSRLYEISSDQVTWRSAGDDHAIFPLVNTSRATVPIELSVSPSPQAEESSKSSGDVAGAKVTGDEDSVWHYSDGTVKGGPKSAADLRQMAEVGAVGPETMVWRAGMREWLPVSEVGILPPAASLSFKAKWPMFAVIGVTAVLVVITGFVAVAVLKPSRGIVAQQIIAQSPPVANTASPPLATPAAPHTPRAASDSAVLPNSQAHQAGASQVIDSINNEAGLSNAVGLVVAGAMIRMPKGDEGEIAESTGSGFVVSPQGHILTNRHVVESVFNMMKAEALREKIRREQLIEYTPRIWVFIEGQKYIADPIYVSSKEDLAVLKIDRDGGWYFEMAAKPSTQRGVKVYALGFPGLAASPVSDEELAETIAKRWIAEGRQRPASDIRDLFKDRDFQFSSSAGEVNRRYTETGGRPWIEHGAVIRNGNSGGPLVDERGLVLAINTCKQVDSEGKSNASTNLAYEIYYVYKSINQYIPNGRWR